MYVEEQLTRRENKIDIVLSHTCPINTNLSRFSFKGLTKVRLIRARKSGLEELREKLDISVGTAGIITRQRKSIKSSLCLRIVMF